tara:strand:+ start:141 stop:323 length:183 start_codon:yes stop_codon:yes gene_type:complete
MEQINEVRKAECLDAIEYLFRQGYLNDMTGDQRYYTKVLLKKVANIYRMQLVGIDEMDGW